MSTDPQDGCHCQSRGLENLNPIQQQPMQVLHIRLVFPPWYEADIAERPAGGMRYCLEVGNMKKTRQTGWDGTIVETVPAAATSGKLTIWPPQASCDAAPLWTVNLAIGDLPPAVEDRGAVARLNNLGLFAGEVGGEDFDARFSRALARFYTLFRIPSTESHPFKRIEEIHGS